MNGEYGPLLSIAHLTPFGVSPAVHIPAAAVHGGGGGGSSSGEWPDAAGWKMLCEVSEWGVGGCCAVCCFDWRVVVLCPT